MSNWDEDDDGYCTAAQDFQDARAVARELGIPLHRVSFAARVPRARVRAFPARARAGRTPNPDVLCNREIKFGVALDYARRLGGELFRHRPLRAARQARRGRRAAQGARRRQGSELLPARRATRALLARTLMPLGRAARRPPCASARARRDCRCSTSPTAPASASSASARSGSFSRSSCAKRPGRSRPRRASVSARIAGLAFYTLGQREGLQIGGRRGRRRAALVRGRQGRRAQRAHRRAGPRSPAAVAARR